MKENQMIKEMYFEEGLKVPKDIEERLNNFPQFQNETTSPREKFLIMTTNDLLMSKQGETLDTGIKYCIALDDKDKEIYKKLIEELKQIWRGKENE